jgi:predicted CoA-binding protein
MDPAHNEQESIRQVLQHCRVIAVVGMSANPMRDSYRIAQYMQMHGYRIVPVNPTHAGTAILGKLCHATLQEAAAALVQEGARIDMVDCFRRPDAIEPIAEAAIEIGAQCLWMQLGVVNEAAAEKARAAGLVVVVDRCLKIEHAHL